LGTILAGKAVTAAPFGLAIAFSGTALASAATQTGTTLTLLKIMTMTKLKIGIISAIVVAGVVTDLSIQHRSRIKLLRENQALLQQIAQLQLDYQSLSNRLTLGKNLPAPHLPAPRMQVPSVPTEDLQATNLYARIKDKSPKLTAEQAEAYLKANGRSAASLLAVALSALLAGLVVARLHERLRHAEALELSRAEAEALSRRFAFLEQGSLILSSARDFETVFRDLSRLLIPTLADWCTIHLANEEGTLRFAAGAHRDPSRDLVVRALAEYGLMILRWQSVYEMVFENRVTRAFLRAIPGLDDYALLGKAWFHTTEEKRGKPVWDTVVFDMPASGHSVSMLRVPWGTAPTFCKSPMVTCIDIKKRNSMGATSVVAECRFPFS